MPASELCDPGGTGQGQAHPAFTSEHRNRAVNAMTFHAVFHKRNSLFLHLEVPKHQVFFEAGMASPTWLSLSAIGTEHAY